MRKALHNLPKLAIFILLNICTGYYVYQSIQQHGGFEKDITVDHSCQFYKERLERLNLLVQATHDAFNSHQLPHFLHYGSIWGVLRGYKGPLPWDYDVDFGTVYTDDTRNKMEIICKTLSKKNISCHYDFGGASYKIHFVHGGGKQLYNVVVDVFLLIPTWYGYVRRFGWETWVLPLHYFIHHSFPGHFVQGGSLPKFEFAGRNISAPKDGVEIMRYLYRSSWNKILKPKYNC